MHFYDQHLHTYLSFDSDELFENYLAYQPEVFVATDHFDLHNPCSNFTDDIPDYDELLDKHMELESKYDTKLLRGIEIGVVPGQEARINTYLADHPYDLRLVSIHQNGQFDYMDDVVTTMDKFAVMDQYFTQMEHVLEHFHHGQILTHFEYGLRRLAVTPEELAERYEEQLTRIFKQIINKNMGFELNAKSFGRYQNASLYDYAVPLYQSLGGKLFTLGSDAHVAEDYRLLFPEMTQLLQRHGVTELALFNQDEIQLVTIESVEN